MFVTPIEHAVQKRKKQKQRSVVDPVTRERQLKRNLADLEKDNFSDIRFEIPKDLLQRRVLPISVRRILSSRKTFVNYLDETPNSRYNTCVAKPSYKPPRKFCNNDNEDAYLDSTKDPLDSLLYTRNLECYHTVEQF
ncbi:SWR1 complex subunit vps71 [Schizosaccharomyces pombe]